MLTLNEFIERMASYDLQSKSASHKKGWDAEIAAAKFLASKGYSHFQMAGCGAGPDITALSPFGTNKTFEVKSAWSVNKGRTWGVRPVSPLRRADDFVLIVLPNNTVLQFEMREHLRLCSRRGSRTITNLVRRYSPESLSFFVSKRRGRPLGSRTIRRLEKRPTWTGLPALETWR